MKASKEHKPQQSRVVSCSKNKSIYQLSPWLPIDYKVREIDLETGNLRDKETQKEYKPITIPDTFNVKNIKAASKNANGIGSLYFEKENRNGVKEQQRIRFVHKSGPQASGIHKDVHWEVIDNHIYEFEGYISTALKSIKINPQDSIVKYLQYTNKIKNLALTPVNYNGVIYYTDYNTADIINKKGNQVKSVKDLHFHKSRGVPLIWNGNTKNEITENGPVDSRSEYTGDGIKQDGIDALYRTAHICKSIDTISANMLMHLVVNQQIKLGRLPKDFDQYRALFGDK